VSPSNFLLLDEPTNHLDLRAKDILLEALRGFSGTAVFVSHDRYFLDGVATRVFEVLDYKVTVYPGNYEDYLWRKAGGAEQLNEKLQLETARPVAVKELPAAAPIHVTETVVNGDAGAGKRMNPIKRRQMEERLVVLERAVPEKEAAIGETEQALGVYVSAEEMQRLTERLAGLRAQHAALVAEWEELSLSLE
jgi:ATP-binding cassette subfamily F protein 3